MKRDDVIKQVAQAVGPSHSVDLKHYDCLILIDIYRNVLGMSVVGSDYEGLKRFNLAEIYDPTPQRQDEKVGGMKPIIMAPDTLKHHSASPTIAPATQVDADGGEPRTTTPDLETVALQSADTRLDKAETEVTEVDT